MAEPGDQKDLTLALGAAEARLQISIATADGNLLFAQEWHAPSRGVELLAPALDSALRLAGRSVRDIARIACVRGPGSFTGLRLALVSASGLARSVDALMAGLDYMPLLAMNAFPFLPESGTPLWVVTHARQNLVHAQAFTRAENGSPRPLTELLVLHIEDELPENRLVSHMAALQDSAVLVGSGVTRNAAALLPALRAEGVTARHPGPLFDHPSLATLIQAAHAAEYSDADPRALYARPCDAEENLPRIAARLGLDPQEAREKLDHLTQSITLCE